MSENRYGADQIRVLEGLEAVRQAPGMYIGSTGRSGILQLVHEIVDNSVDEYLAGFCNSITVTLGKDGSCTVEDNGRGIPVEMHEKGLPAERVVLTTLHAGGKFGDGAYHTSGGLHGVGSSVVNALSEWMTVEIRRNGKIYSDSYSRGMPVTKLSGGLLPAADDPSGNTGSGTKISFKPDPDIFEDTSFRADDIAERLHETAYLCPDLTLAFRDERDGTVMTFLEKNGLSGFIASLTETEEPVSPVISFSGKENGIEAEIAFQYTDSYRETLLGYCNNIANPEGGTHLTGFRTALTSVLNQQARKSGVLKDKDDNFTGTDIRSGLTAVISVRHPAPRFEGQTKTKLDNQDAAKAVQKIAGEELGKYFDRHPDVLKSVLSCAERAAKIRRQEERAKGNKLVKSRFSTAGNGKLANCISRKPAECEIFIVEGDSAGGSAKTARNRHTQAILPIRGKILNVEKASMDKVLANAEIREMINAFGCGFSEGYGNDFDIKRLRYDKIVIMADADVDGAHIGTLLLTLFYRFMPDLIREGHVYIAMPPLYRADDGKTATYLYDDKELAHYRKSHKKKFAIQRYKGLGEMDPEQLWETTLNPATRMMKRVNLSDAADAARITSLLMGNKVEPRRNFICENAGAAAIDA